MCQVYSVFDLTVGKVVCVTGGDLSCAGSILYVNSLWERVRV